MRLILTIATVLTTLAIPSSAYGQNTPVAQNINQNGTFFSKDVLNGNPAVCLVKKLADDLAERDEKCDKEKEALKKIVDASESKIQELEKQISNLKAEITARDNRDLLKKQYEDKLLDLVKENKKVEDSRWSRSTYFWIGNLVGIVQGLGTSYIYSRVIK